ncbi:tRNA (adenosine(37)-N6)-threonylcarbamoyltransferase complex ATPase subunit type 1 TsaE [Candidatus Microgenomates bacterium]|nr:tRNA (adenosine(37)-N6)-threonylcarbamoyltransferase complex ATPase subunit type 1 TsaE [Candidatus Microgenomates bacterium]
MEIVTNSSEETERVAKRFARKLSGGEILALVGELGSGKTTFVQGLAEGLGIKKRVISPTFIIMRHYLVTQPPNNPITHFYHVDLYRLEKNIEHEIKGLGFGEIWGKQENIIAIEWAEKIRRFLPKSTIWINFEQFDENSRKIMLDTESMLV